MGGRRGSSGRAWTDRERRWRWRKRRRNANDDDSPASVSSVRRLDHEDWLGHDVYSIVPWGASGPERRRARGARYASERGRGNGTGAQRSVWVPPDLFGQPGQFP